MKIVINIKTDNAAFQDNPYEVNNILEKVIRKLDQGEREANLHDTNGNMVGNFKVTGKSLISWRV
jgi:hypothetical protein